MDEIQKWIISNTNLEVGDIEVIARTGLQAFREGAGGEHPRQEETPPPGTSDEQRRGAGTSAGTLPTRRPPGRGPCLERTGLFDAPLALDSAMRRLAARFPVLEDPLTCLVTVRTLATA